MIAIYVLVSKRFSPTNIHFILQLNLKHIFEKVIKSSTRMMRLAFSAILSVGFVKSDFLVPMNYLFTVVKSTNNAFCVFAMDVETITMSITMN